MSGGSFEQSFLTAAISSIVAGGYGMAAGDFAGKGVGQVLFGTFAGGATASLTGGNFWEGAVTGLVVSGLNHAMHQMGNDQDPPTKSREPWDTNGDGRLQKGEADNWYLNGKGATINVDNSLIDWQGLEMPLSTKVGSEFTIQTHDAFIDLPFETSSTYGGTPFVRTGSRTANIIDQEYHYRLRPNNSVRNFVRNILNEFGKPGGSYYGQGYNNHYSPPAGQSYMIHFVNPTIRFK